MSSRKLQKTVQDGRVNYKLTISKELVDQLGWEKGDEIQEDLTIGGSGAGQIKLEKLECQIK